jgi:hypothetical protein
MRTTPVLLFWRTGGGRLAACCSAVRWSKALRFTWYSSRSQSSRETWGITSSVVAASAKPPKPVRVLVWP